MKRFSLLFLVVLFLFQGCGTQTRTTVTDGPTSDEALVWFKDQLQRYADGGMMLEEQSSFPNYLEALKKDQPDKAALLETELPKLTQASRADLSKKAKALLGKL